MYWILFVMGAMVAVVLALFVGGLATPREHTVSRTVIVPAPREQVWMVIRDFSRYADWRHELEHAEVVADSTTQPQWREISTRRAITFGVTQEEPPLMMVARILDVDVPFTGEWRWELHTHSEGTSVSLTEHGAVGNPIFRFIGTHFLGHTKSIDLYLKHLSGELLRLRD